MRTMWGDKPYYSLNYALREQFGTKVYKLSLDGGMTCPNRDGTLGTGGCIFCSAGGSGDFAEKLQGIPDIPAQIETAKRRVSNKVPADAKYIAYFQSYTNTYAPVSYLRPLFTAAISHPDIAVLSIGTRPDCISDECLLLLEELNSIKPVWVELGLQTIHESTALAIRRGYPLPVFEDCFRRLKKAGIPVIVHVILGLPEETPEMMLQTVSYLGDLGIDGIKLQLLHVLSGTDLGKRYQENPFPVFDLDSYVKLAADCLAVLPQSVVIHRISGDGPKSLLLAPLWSGNKKQMLNAFSKYLRENKIYQGSDLCILSYNS